MRTWILFGWLVITAIVYYYIGTLVLFVFGLFMLVWLWMQLANRWPIFGILLLGFIRGLLGTRW